MDRINELKLYPDTRLTYCFVFENEEITADI